MTQLKAYLFFTEDKEITCFVCNKNDVEFEIRTKPTKKAPRVAFIGIHLLCAESIL